MKNTISLFAALLLCLSLSVSAQVSTSSTTVYFNEKWENCDPAQAHHYRIIESDSRSKELLKVTDYYIDGNKMMEGSYKGQQLDVAMGKFVWYHPNGSKSQEGIYKYGTKSGTWKKYYENGELMEKSHFNNGTLDGEYVAWFSNGMIQSTGNYADGELDGNWKWFEPNGMVSNEDIYLQGKRNKVAYKNADGTKFKVKKEGVIMPEFPGGKKSLVDYLTHQVRYPEAAKVHELEGTVYVRFMITDKGKVTDVEVIEGVSRSLDREAIRVIQKMPKWTPGYEEGRAVNIKYIIPIQFKLT